MGQSDDIVLEGGGYHAVLRRTGAALHTLRYAGHDLVLPGAGGPTPDFAGMVLAPWVNRVVDARYTFHGEEYALPVNEPERGHALHGLLWTQPGEVVAAEENRAVLRHRLRDAPGYPFRVDVMTTYSIGADGLTCEIAAVNAGADPAPYGCGAHPYLLAVTGRVDDCVLELSADERLVVTEDRLVPRGLVAVHGTEFDFSRPRTVGELRADHAFTGLERGADGRARARVTDTEGYGVELWADRAFGWLHVFTGDRDGAAWDRRGLALEPTSCPPDAFNTGRDLVVLAPGEEHRATWGLSAVAASE